VRESDVKSRRHWNRCIEFKRQSSITGCDGLKAIEAALDAYESNKNSSPVFFKKDDAVKLL
jgi:hypothetical protein